MYICVYVCTPGDNDRLIFVAKNFGGRYRSRVFDNDLGYVSTFLLYGNYIFADKVSIVNVLLIK